MKVSGPAFKYIKESSDGDSLSFEDSVAAVKEDLRRLSSDNPIFEAHLEIAYDPMIEETYLASKSESRDEFEALSMAEEQIVRMFDSVDDEYLKARVDDVKDIFCRIGEKMRGRTRKEISIPAGCILVAEELLPSDTSYLDLALVRGIICKKGSLTSHVCIIAHSKGIPVATGIDIDSVENGQILTVDDPMVGDNGIAEKVKSSGRKLYANAGSVDDVARAILDGADGIGLFRTEFLFLDRDEMPSEDEQFAVYKAAVDASDGKPLTIRTLDIGGDKQVPWIDIPHEDNPFLGLRGIRLCLAHPDILKVQLRAVLRASDAVDSSVRIMIPMVCSPDEVMQVKSLLSECAKETGSRKLPPVGIMVETPASVLCAGDLASVSDFFSVGTNDLTQYLMAADRGNASVAYLYNALSEPVKCALQMVVKAAHDNDIEVCICGEMASDPRATSFLIETGFDSLSVSAV